MLRSQALTYAKAKMSKTVYILTSAAIFHRFFPCFSGTILHLNFAYFIANRLIKKERKHSKAVCNLFHGPVRSKPQ